jgi:hypothetical protein
LAAWLWSQRRPITEGTLPWLYLRKRECSGPIPALLTPDGNKAPNAAGKAKIMRGVCNGAPITISPPNDLLGMAVTEGIEDGLSVYQGTGLCVWSAGSAVFMPALAPLIPDFIDTVTIYAHDDAGRGYAIDLARAIKARGIEVLVQGL